MRLRLWTQWRGGFGVNPGLFLEVGRWGFYVHPLRWAWKVYGLSFKENDDGFSYLFGPFTVERAPSGVCFD